MDSSIIIVSTQGQKKLQKSITHINPAATNAQLASLGSSLNALTTNAYAYTKKVTVVECDTEPDNEEG